MTAKRRIRAMRDYLEQRFTARVLPEAIDINGELVAGPFCYHCGNPFSLHGPDLRCPNHHLHPLFPPPKLPRARVVPRR